MKCTGVEAVPRTPRDGSVSDGANGPGHLVMAGGTVAHASGSFHFQSPSFMKGLSMSTASYVLDIDDSHDAGDELRYRVDTPAGERIDVPRLQRYATPKKSEWAWPGKIPLGTVTVIEGGPGSGKSFVALDLAARLNGALGWPDGQKPVLPDADVLVICRNDHPSKTISARFQKAGGDPQRLYHFREFGTYLPQDRQHGDRPFLFPFDMPALEKILEDHPAIGVIVIDPLSDFCETPRQLRETLFRLEDLAERANAVILVTLPADCRTDAQGRLKVKSRWATDVVRCNWCLITDPDNPKRRLFVAKRTNSFAEPDGLSFELSDQGVVWDADDPIDPDDPLGQLAGSEKCLEEILSQGDVAASQIFRQGAECGFTPREMRAAAKRLGIGTTRVGYGGDGHWAWWYATAAPQTDELEASATGEPQVDPSLPLGDGRREGEGPGAYEGEEPNMGEGAVVETAVLTTLENVESLKIAGENASAGELQNDTAMTRERQSEPAVLKMCPVSAKER